MDGGFSMKQAAIPQPAVKSRSGLNPKWFAVLVVLALIVAAVVLGYRWWLSNQEASKAAALAARQKAAEQAMADFAGIRVTKVIVTADGGLVDLRYQVIDPDKADFLFTDLDFVPKLVPAGTDKVISLTDVPHKHGLQSGLQYFIIYRNVDGLVTPCGYVDLMIGDVRL